MKSDSEKLDSDASVIDYKVQRQLVRRAWLQAQQLLFDLRQEDQRRRRAAQWSLVILLLLFGVLTLLLLKPELLADLARQASIHF